ncbi:MAG TPA: hypothetical protein VJZ27_19445, partial [Aggregatilineales bacterium]|nr:hypothetical protein [Aggregatilineales bacterium]
MRTRLRFLAVLILAAVFTMTAAYAQPSTCLELLNQAVAVTLEQCATMQPGEICRGAGSIETLPSNLTTIGTRLSLESIESIHSSGASIISMQFRAANESSSVLYAFGTLEISRTQNASFPAWQAFDIRQSGGICSGNDRVAGVLLQASEAERGFFAVNNLTISFNQTIFLMLQDNHLQIDVIEGDAVVENSGESVVIFAGFGWTASDNGESDPIPYNYNAISTLPVNLLPHIPRVPLPGQVEVATETLLFIDAATNSVRVLEEPLLPGTLLNVYGSDLTGTWRHVITPSGESGWIPAESLVTQPEVVLPAYD